MIFLVAVLVPPLYFALRKKWPEFVFSAVLYALGVVLCLTIILLPAGVSLLGVTVAHSCWHLLKELMREHADMIAEALSRKQGGGNV